MDCAHGGSFFSDDSGVEDAQPPVAESRPETELEFLTRRAMEESRLAKRASSPHAAAAHSYLAAAYSAAVAREVERQNELESLLLRLP